MLSTGIVIFREALEIAIILGIVLAATRGLSGRMAWIFGGVAGGVTGAALVAVFAGSISDSLSGMGQEVFNAGVLFTAALFIGWTVVWMRKHAREMVGQLKQVGHDVSNGNLPFYSLSVVIGLAILREGAEIVLFVYGMMASGQSISSIVAGSSVGLFAGTVVGVLLYYGILKIPAKYMLQVTSWILVLLVAGLASQGAGFLVAAGYFENFSATVWDTSWLLNDATVTAQMLKSLVGYTAQPSEAELAFYAGTLLTMVAIIKSMSKKTAKPVAAN